MITRSRTGGDPDMHIGRDRWLGKLFKWLDLSVRGCSVVVGAFRTSKAEKFPDFMSGFINYIQQGWVVPTFLIGLPVVVHLKNKTDRSKLEAVHSLLDQICDAAFKSQEFELNQHRRVTLFQHKKLCLRRWPYVGGWLIPIERSGNHTRKTDAIFFAPDDGEKSEGVAGRTWSRDKNIYVKSLPNLRAPNATDEDIKKYAELSFCKEKMLRKGNRPQSRSLYGIPVKVGYKSWGVMVVDSVSEEISTRRVDNVFKQLAPTMASYLKGL